MIKIARENAPSILQQFKIRKEQIKQKHILLLKQRKEEKVKKEKAKQQELEQLTKDIVYQPHIMYFFVFSNLKIVQHLIK
jgi:hypothetical protein